MSQIAGNSTAVRCASNNYSAPCPHRPFLLVLAEPEPMFDRRTRRDRAITRTTTAVAAASSCLVVAMLAILLPAAHAGRDVRITYEENGAIETRNFDLLVVACNPKYLVDVFDGRTDVEERVEAAIETYTLGTSLWDVRRMEGEGNTYSMRISPEQLSASDGQGQPHASAVLTWLHERWC